MQLVQDIIKASLQQCHFNGNISKSLNQIIKCHTSELGYLIIKCDKCNHREIIPKSCRNRNCPVCQKSAQEKWVNKWLSEMLDCSYYHIVATTPDILYQIIYQNQEIMYKLLQKTSAQAVMKLAKDEKYLGANVGLLQILHTWNQRMLYHPHCHMLVTAGGVKDDKWIDAKNKKFLFPVKAYSIVYRGMFIEELKKARKKLKFYGTAKKYENKVEWNKLINELYKKEFVTYVKKPYESPVTVMEYFGRYAHRVAISPSRIISYQNGVVKFKYKDRKDEGKEKIEELSDIDFTKRLALHILPKGFRKIKAYGIFANAYRKQRIAKIKNILYKVRHRIIEFVKKELYKRSCSKCGSEEIEIVSLNFKAYLVPT